MTHQYNPTDGLRNVDTFPSNPAAEADARNQVQTVLDQAMDAVNEVETDMQTNYATKAELDGMILGQIPDNSITDSKLHLPLEVAGGTATSITLSTPTLYDKYSKTFIATNSNNGESTTINSKPLYKPGTTTSPYLKAGNPYLMWYDQTNNCFLIEDEITTIKNEIAVMETEIDSKQNNLGYTPVNKAGDTMSGALTVPTLMLPYGTKISETSGQRTAINAESNRFDVLTEDGTTNILSARYATALLQFMGNTVWHAGNDGPGSTLDSDTVRGITFRINSGVLQYSTDGGVTWQDMAPILTPFSKELSISPSTANVWTTVLSITSKGKISRCMLKASSTVEIHVRVTTDGNVVHHSSNNGAALSSFGIEQEKNVSGGGSSTSAYSRTPNNNSLTGLSTLVSHPYTSGGQFCVILDDGIPFNNSLLVEVMTIASGGGGALSIEGGTY